ncbi:formate dehydrogenase beta subunit [Kordiimonas lacus]|uniref:Formate dehydrogenase beta subunit n=1 Tax=Kordiimonas lacus TaxID=637679 RepID=A0A1G7BE83_9PROT|nr:formate dehydrogenase beta subunit [Kordiimonas lacus]SDE25394.1 formate dehydrogenase beta subunit [Kordiimonas lacus]
MTKIYVPLDSSAVAMGADEVAAKIEAITGIAPVRNGSRGMAWLEPLVEVETPKGRVAYGPVTLDDVAGLIRDGMMEGRAHALCHGLTEELPFLARQERLTFARCGITNPLSMDEYASHGGLDGIQKAIGMSAEAICDEVMTSGLRGRGGAAFPAGIKWNTVRGADADQKYIVCNADEGDSGTFADRMIMEGDPLLLIEGMAIAGLGTGATKGYIYLRSEYPVAKRVLTAAIDRAYWKGLLGNDVLGSGKAFHLEVFMGAGAYICGEETSLLESLEGKRGQVRAKPPLPALEGLMAKPTLVHNVISLCAVPTILAKGGEFYRDHGMGRSTGTMPFQIAGNVACGGLVEKAFGVTLGELVNGFGGGTRSGRPIKAAQVGGPLGAYIPLDKFDMPMDYETFAKIGAGVGHGGIVVFDDTADMAEQAKYAFDFCAHESCGKCTPCRIGAVRGSEEMAKLIAGGDATTHLTLVEDLCEVMEDGSLCAMGGMTPVPVKSALDYFPEDFLKGDKG